MQKVERVVSRRESTLEGQGNRVRKGVSGQHFGLNIDN